MKRGFLLILLVVLLVDLSQDGCLGEVSFGPQQVAVSTSLRDFNHPPSGQEDSSPSLPSADWRDLFNPRPSQPVVHIGQVALKIIIPCNNSSSGGIPL
jgi:hypothetical protein